MRENIRRKKGLWVAVVLQLCVHASIMQILNYTTGKCIPFSLCSIICRGVEGFYVCGGVGGIDLVMKQTRTWKFLGAEASNFSVVGLKMVEYNL